MIDQAQKLREIFSSQKKEGAKTPSLEKNNSAKKKTSFCKTIAITSGKGGVGKSNICISLGIALSAMKKRVCIFDADLGLANIHILLGISPSKNLSHYIAKSCSLNDIISSLPNGICIIPASSGLETMADLEPLQLKSLIREMALLEQNYDYILIDTSAGIGRNAVEFASCADMSILVVTPEPTSLADAYAMAKILINKNTDAIYVIVNMAESDSEGKETFDKLNALVVKFLKKKLNFLGVIPFDKQVGNFVKYQKLPLLDGKKSMFNIRSAQCARVLLGMQQKEKESFFERFFALKKPIK